MSNFLQCDNNYLVPLCNSLDMMVIKIIDGALWWGSVIVIDGFLFWYENFCVSADTYRISTYWKVLGYRLLRASKLYALEGRNPGKAGIHPRCFMHKWYRSTGLPRHRLSFPTPLDHWERRLTENHLTDDFDGYTGSWRIGFRMPPQVMRPAEDSNQPYRL